MSYLFCSDILYIKLCSYVKHNLLSRILQSSYMFRNNIISSDFPLLLIFPAIRNSSISDTGLSELQMNTILIPVLSLSRFVLGKQDMVSERAYSFTP